MIRKKAFWMTRFAVHVLMPLAILSGFRVNVITHEWATTLYQYVSIPSHFIYQIAVCNSELTTREDTIRFTIRHDTTCPWCPRLRCSPDLESSRGHHTQPPKGQSLTWPDRPLRSSVPFTCYGSRSLVPLFFATQSFAIPPRRGGRREGLLAKHTDRLGTA